MDAMHDILQAVRAARTYDLATSLALAVSDYGFTARPVAMAELAAAGVRREAVARALLARAIAPVARRIYAEADGPLLAAFLGMGGFATRRTLPPAQAILAYALAQQHGWRLAPGTELARYFCLTGDRPTWVSAVGYDQAAARRIRGLDLEPLAPALIELPVAGQVLLLGLQCRIDGATELGLDAHGRLMARCRAWHLDGLLQGLRQVIDALPEPHRIVAGALLHEFGRLDSRHQRAMRCAPLNWQPPADVDAAVRVERWQLVICEVQDGDFECLVGVPINHPYAERQLRSSPIVWIDEKAGWAQAESRLYRLGARART